MTNKMDTNLTPGFKQQDGEVDAKLMSKNASGLPPIQKLLGTAAMVNGGDNKVFKLLELALNGHMTQEQQNQFIADAQKRGLISNDGREKDAGSSIRLRYEYSGFGGGTLYSDTKYLNYERADLISLGVLFELDDERAKNFTRAGKSRVNTLAELLA